MTIIIFIFLLFLLIFILILSLFYVDEKTDYNLLIRNYRNDLEKTSNLINKNNKIIKSLEGEIRRSTKKM